MNDNKKRLIKMGTFRTKTNTDHNQIVTRKMEFQTLCGLGNFLSFHLCSNFQISSVFFFRI